ncbi:MAG: FAD-binding protein [Terrimesophilobacter sp.]
MTELSRRQLLGLGGAALLLGAPLSGCTALAGSRPSATPHVSASATPAATTDWSKLSSRVDGRLVVPGDGAYDSTRRVENPRYDSAMPLAILVAASAADVAAGLAFAADYHVPLALRSGGHSYPGWSAGGADSTGLSPALVIDTRGMTTVAMADNGSARVGAGASLAQVYSAVGGAGRALAAGSCATVGVAGLTLGGGVGVLVRAYGLTCDALTELQIVTADGNVRTVSDTADPDLFWACRGGGGGHLGVVTSLTFATHEAPPVTTWNLRWPFADAAAVITAWQAWAPHADPKLWSTLKLLNGAKYTAGPGLFLSGTWIGEPSAVDSVLAPLLSAVGTQPSQQGSVKRSYLDAMMGYAGCRNIPARRCSTAPGGELTRVSSAATSHVAYAPLNDSGISTLVATVESAKAVPGLTEAGVSLDALGGAVAEVRNDATAFGHRSAMMTVQYTATFPNGTDPALPDSYVHGFRTAMVPYWGYGAYVNYADASITGWADAYFAGNATRLNQVRRQYDPHGLFTQPQ